MKEERPATDRRGPWRPRLRRVSRTSTKGVRRAARRAIKKIGSRPAESSARRRLRCCRAVTWHEHRRLCLYLNGRFARCLNIGCALAHQAPSHSSPSSVGAFARRPSLAGRRRSSKRFHAHSHPPSRASSAPGTTSLSRSSVGSAARSPVRTSSSRPSALPWRSG